MFMFWDVCGYLENHPLRQPNPSTNNLHLHDDMIIIVILPFGHKVSHLAFFNTMKELDPKSVNGDIRAKAKKQKRERRVL